MNEKLKNKYHLTSVGYERRCITPSRPLRCTQSWTPTTINCRRSVVDCRPHLPCLSSPPGAVNTRPTAVVVSIALADSMHRHAKFHYMRMRGDRTVFTRDSICYSAYMPWQFRLSLCPSVTRVDQSKVFEVRIMQFSPYSSPIPLVSAG